MKKTISRFYAFHELCHDEQGASATEYSVLIVLIILVALLAVSLLGIQVNLAFERFIEVLNEVS